MKIFISTKFKGLRNKKELEYLEECLDRLGYKHFLAVKHLDDFGRKPISYDTFMEKALENIKKCDICLIYFSDKGIGIGIEAGMAKALKRKIVVLVPKKRKVSMSLEGIADKILRFNKKEDILNLLKRL